MDVPFTHCHPFVIVFFSVVYCVNVSKLLVLVLLIAFDTLICVFVGSWDPGVFIRFTSLVKLRQLNGFECIE